MRKKGQAECCGCGGCGSTGFAVASSLPITVYGGLIRTRRGNRLLSIIEYYQSKIDPKMKRKLHRKRICMYHPTCSEYTKEAIMKYGSFLGIVKGAFRILRCNPFSSGGYDPVR